MLYLTNSNTVLYYQTHLHTSLYIVNSTLHTVEYRINVTKDKKEHLLISLVSLT